MGEHTAKYYFNLFLKYLSHEYCIVSLFIVLMICVFLWLRKKQGRFLDDYRNALNLICFMIAGFWVIDLGSTKYGILVGLALILIAGCFLIMGIYSIYDIFKKKKDAEGAKALMGSAIEFYIEFAGAIVVFFTGIFFGVNKLTKGLIYNLGTREPLSTEFCFDYFYYSVITSTTLGYGDIVPVSFLLKAISMVEAMFGIVFLIYLFSVIIAVISER